MRIFTSADNRRAYRIKAVVNDSVLYDVAFNDTAPLTDLDIKFGGDAGVTNYNRVMPLDRFSVHLASLGVYFGPGREHIIAAGYSVQ